MRWLKLSFSQAFVAWIHLKALRVFVESVLRSDVLTLVLFSQHYWVNRLIMLCPAQVRVTCRLSGFSAAD